MKFSIGKKISLLTSILVLCTAVFIASWVLNTSVYHVIDHEVVDLVEETNLSAALMRENLTEFRRRVALLAGSKGFKADLEKVIRGGDAKASQTLETLPKECQQIFTDQPSTLRVELLRYGPNQEPRSGNPIVAFQNPAVKSFSKPTSQDSLLKELLHETERRSHLSEFGQADVEFVPDSSPDRPGEVHSNGRKLIVQAAFKVRPEQLPEQFKGDTVIVLGTMHFRLLDSDPSDQDAMAMSPRHFIFLINPQGQYLQYPDSKQVYDLKTHHGLTLAGGPPAMQDRMEALRKLMSLTTGLSAAELKLKKSRGMPPRTDEPAQIPELSSWFGYSSECPPEIVDLFDPSPDDPNFNELIKQGNTLKAELVKIVSEHPGFRYSVPSRNNRRFKVRSHSDNRADLITFQKEIDDRFRTAGVKAKLAWEAPVHLKNFAVHVVRLDYNNEVSNQGETAESPKQKKYADLAVAVSYEEIAADVNNEVRKIQFKAIWLGLAAGGLAALFSLIITRPLNKIITSTERIAQGDFDVQLPVKDHGEIGVLARSFKNMVEQIRERNRNLAEEQQKIRELNDDLRGQKESLEFHVDERTSELRKTAAELGIARDEAMEASRAKSAFLAQMSHELRTPLNAIIGYGELLVEEVTEEGAEQFVPDLKKIIDAGRHLLALINDILDLSKIEAGKMELYREIVDVLPMLESVVSTVEPLVRKNSNRLEWKCDPAVTTLFIDRTRLRQILLNLLSNACKFTDKGTIRLTAEKQVVEGCDFAVFKVRDSGIGMTPEQLKKLFQNFQQADASTTRKYGGTGLGLAITKRICEMMGGDITVTSEHGTGSTFTVRIPLIHQAPAAEAAPEVPIAVENQGTAGTVLVIDDDASARDLLQRYLTKEGFKVETAAGGEEGLKRARELQPAFITLDVMMPKMDGWDVLSALKAEKDLCDIPVVMLTMVEGKNLGIALGATDFMTKPIDRDRLISLAARYRNGAAGNHSILVVEDDAPNRTLISRILSGAGWTVTEAENGKVALDVMPECRPALIVLDLMMPVMDGFSFLEELRKRDDLSNTPVLIVTAKELSADERNWLNGEVRQILQKGSYGREQLLEQVRRIMPVRGENGAPSSPAPKAQSPP